MGWTLLVAFNGCMLLYLCIFHVALNKHEAFTRLQDVTGSSLILRYKLSAQCFWTVMRVLGKAIKQLMWGISALMPLIWALLHLKWSVYLLSAAYPANFLSLSLKKNIKLYNKSLHSSTGDSKRHSTHTLLLLQLSHCLVLKIRMWIPLYQSFLSWLRLCQS